MAVACRTGLAVTLDKAKRDEVDLDGKRQHPIAGRWTEKRGGEGLLSNLLSLKRKITEPLEARLHEHPRA